MKRGTTLKSLFANAPECLVVGRKGLEKIVGKDVVKAALASTKFPGQRRAVPRATWEGYCFPNGPGWVVGCSSVADLTRLGLQGLPAIESAIGWAELLRRGGEPHRPPRPIYTPGDWDEGDPEEIVALDFEGHQSPDRVSLCTFMQSLTCQWDQAARKLTARVLGEARIILCHSATFDIPMAEACGIEVDRRKVFDTMVAHQILNPWRKRGLGHCAPLYVAVEPWKHKMEDAMEEYSLMDAAVLLPMYLKQWGQICQRKQTAVLETEMRLSWHLKDCRPRVFGAENYVTRAAGAVEPTNQLFSLCDWTDLCEPREMPSTLRLKSPLKTAMRLLVEEEDFSGLSEMEALHVLGFGVRQIRNGSKLHGIDGLRPNETETETRARLKAFDDRHPAFVQWREHSLRLAKRDGYVAAPSGRRAYGVRGGDVQRFLILATLFDQLKAVALLAGPSAYSAIFPLGFVTQTPEKLIQTDILPKEDWAK